VIGTEFDWTTLTTPAAFIVGIIVGAALAVRLLDTAIDVIEHHEPKDDDDDDAA
jgi:uncharacterized membrane-anchored protein YhcB (DUF1043 family)